MSYGYLLSICLILLSTKFLSLCTGKLHMPQVVGSLLAGLVLGPAVLGWLQPNDFLNELAELGVIVIMFNAGMGTSIKELKNSGKAGFLVALIGVLVPLAMGAVLMWAFNPDSSFLSCIFLGTVLTATSVSITVETLKEMDKLNTKVGTTILAAALIDDILGLICLTVVTSMAGGDANIAFVLLKIVLFFVFVFAVGFVYEKAMAWYDIRVHDHNLHRFPILAFALCLFMAWSAETIFGVADIIGAFATGVMVSATPKGSYIQSKFNPLSYLLLTPIFFANIGLKVSLSAMNARMLLFTVCLVAVAIISKLIGCGYIGGKLCGFNTKECTQIGFGMACRGEVALIVTNKGTAMGLLSEEYYCPVIILVVCCAMFTPILLKMAFKGHGKYEDMHGSELVDRYDIPEQLDIVTRQLLTKNDKHKEQRKK